MAGAAAADAVPQSQWKDFEAAAERFEAAVAEGLAGLEGKEAEGKGAGKARTVPSSPLSLPSTPPLQPSADVAVTVHLPRPGPREAFDAASPAATPTVAANVAHISWQWLGGSGSSDNSGSAPPLTDSDYIAVYTLKPTEGSNSSSSEGSAAEGSAAAAAEALPWSHPSLADFDNVEFTDGVPAGEVAMPLPPAGPSPRWLCWKYIGVADDSDSGSRTEWCRGISQPMRWPPLPAAPFQSPLSSPLPSATAPPPIPAPTPTTNSTPSSPPSSDPPPAVPPYFLEKHSNINVYRLYIHLPLPLRNRKKWKPVFHVTAASLSVSFKLWAAAQGGFYRHYALSLEFEEDIEAPTTTCHLQQDYLMFRIPFRYPGSSKRRRPALSDSLPASLLSALASSNPLQCRYALLLLSRLLSHACAALRLCHASIVSSLSKAWAKPEQ